MRLPLVSALIFFGCVFFGAPTDVSAPSSQGFHKLYGEPTMERFVALNGVTLTAEYGPDRLACQLLIAPRRMLIEVEDPSLLMSSQGVSAVLQELLPASARGKQVSSSTVQVDEAITLLKTDYENVSIRRICSSQSCVSSNENQDLRTLVVFKRDACPRHVE